MLLREASLEDVNDILQLQSQELAAPQWSDSVWQQMIGAQCGGLSKKVLLACSEDCIVGWVAASSVDEVVEIESLLVRQGCRNRGWGTRLLQQIAAWAAAGGARILRLEVRAGNQAALHLYRRLGFEQEGLRPAYYQHPQEDALLLRKQL